MLGGVYDTRDHPGQSTMAWPTPEHDSTLDRLYAGGSDPVYHLRPRVQETPSTPFCTVLSLHGRPGHRPQPVGFSMMEQATPAGLLQITVETLWTAPRDAAIFLGLPTEDPVDPENGQL